VGLETYPNIIRHVGSWLHIIDQFLLWIFTVEIAVRLIGSKTIGAFFKNPWNLFDFVIIAAGHLLAGSYYVTVLRILRVLRVLRAISVIPSLRKMVNALLKTIPSMGTIMLLLGLFFYVYGVIGTMLYQEIAPEYFGTLHQTMLTLFQLITLDSWSSTVMSQIMEHDPTAWWYFISFVVIGAFIIINLFVGVIVNNVGEVYQEEEPSPADIKLAKVQEELEEIKKLLKEKSN
jgi:voltage-gated sodium channel